MATRALVLGGGGGTGVAWEIGIVYGLKQAGIDLNDADVIVGTSAGAMVGAQIRQRKNFVQLWQAQVQIAEAGGNNPVRIADPATTQKVMDLMASGVELTAEVRRQMGQWALEAKAQPAETFVGTITKGLGEAWPDKPLRATGVDVEDGSVVAFDKDSGVPLGTAVAISMCVPGMVMPIPAAGRRCMDGGMAGTNIGLAAGYDAVLAVVTRDEPRSQAEVEVLRASGAQVVYLPPDAASARALGETPAERFSTVRRGLAAQEGARQAESAAAEIRTIWG
ncbi:MAG TPA: patatin-like phospholipase family protein [Chloroflexota bacterium]|jgi:NTE family protein|nr:patatin-like phospholipase family protein [Chloroflexota bacterium]